MFISILAGIVMFTTMAGVGMLDNMSASGIATAFIIYPQAIVKISDSPVFNMFFAFIFYFCLITLAIDSLFSIIEGISTAISDKFKLSKKKTTLIICLVEGVISLIYVTGAGLAILDIVDYFINSYTPSGSENIYRTFSGVWIRDSNHSLRSVDLHAVRCRFPYIETCIDIPVHA